MLGAILAAGYAASFAASAEASPQADLISTAVESQLLKSYASAADIATQYPQYSTEIIAAAKSSFLEGANLAYAVGIVIVILGAALVLFCFPRRAREIALLDQYASADAATHS